MKKDEIRKHIVKSLGKTLTDKEKKTIKKVSANAKPLKQNREVAEATEAEVRDMVKTMVTMTRPLVDAARIQQKIYDDSPSIMKGSRMQEVTKKARENCNRVISLIRGHYADYKEVLSNDEYTEIVDDELRKQMADIDPVINRCANG